MVGVNIYCGAVNVAQANSIWGNAFRVWVVDVLWQFSPSYWPFSDLLFKLNQTEGKTKVYFEIRATDSNLKN